MYSLKTTLFTLWLSLLLAACGSESERENENENTFEGKFITEELSGLYYVGGSAMRFEETEEGDKIGTTFYSGLLFEDGFSPTDASRIAENFTWEIDLDGALTVHYPIRDSEIRLTLTEGEIDSGTTLLERASTFGGELDHKVFTTIEKLTPDSLVGEYTNLATDDISDFTLSTKIPEGSINYSFTTNLFSENLKLGKRNDETILWDVYTAEANDLNDIDQSNLIGRILIKRMFIGGIFTPESSPIEIISFTEGDTENGKAQFATYFPLIQNVPVNEMKYQYISNDAIWVKVLIEE